MHVTQTEDGRHDVITTNTRDVTGTGLQTGDEYRFINAGTSQDNSVDLNQGDSSIQEDNQAANLMVISDGASPNFLVHGVYHETFNADGQPLVFFQVIVSGCTTDLEIFRQT